MVLVLPFGTRLNAAVKSFGVAMRIVAPGERFGERFDLGGMTVAFVFIGPAARHDRSLVRR
jgi:hypothetical protein